MRFMSKLGSFLTDSKALYGLVGLMVFLPFALFLAPSVVNISAAEGLSADSDPMLELASTRNVAMDGVSAPVVADAQATESPSEATQTAATVRTGNYLSIAGKVSATVVAVGLDGDGAVAVPSSAIGMYNHGGATFLDGHSTGVFAGLSRVRVGDIAEFTLNSVTSQYRVVNVVTYTYINGDNIDGSFMYDSLYSGGSAGLNMMTCAGAYLPAYGTYSHRLVVFAVRI
jgi:hypothetical protein